MSHCVLRLIYFWYAHFKSREMLMPGTNSIDRTKKHGNYLQLNSDHHRPKATPNTTRGDACLCFGSVIPQRAFVKTLGALV